MSEGSCLQVWTAVSGLHMVQLTSDLHTPIETWVHTHTEGELIKKLKSSSQDGDALRLGLSLRKQRQVHHSCVLVTRLVRWWNKLPAGDPSPAELRCGLTSRQEGDLDGLPWDFQQTFISGEWRYPRGPRSLKPALSG